MLLALIVLIGSLGISKRVPSKLASWVVVILTILGIFTSADVTTRVMYVGAAMLGPLVPYSLQLVYSLTIRPVLHYLRWSSDGHRAFYNVASDDPVNAVVDGKVDEHAESLVSSGFVSRGRVGIRVGDLTVINEIFDRGEGREWAILTAAISPAAQPVILHSTCEFAGGETLAVHNLPWVDSTPPSKGIESVRLPSIGDIGDLVRACLTLAAQSTYGPVVATPLDTDLATKANERTKRRYEAEVVAGYVRYDAANDVYRPTLRGSYRMHWVSLPPLRWIIERRELARERELLEQMRLTPAPRTDTSPGEGAAVATPSTGRQYIQSFAAAAALIAFIVFMPDWPDAIFPDRSFALGKPMINLPANFAVPDSFAGAVQTLERLVGRPSHQLSGTRDDEPNLTPGVAISMHRDTADAYVAAAHTSFLDQGFYLFRTGERATSGLDTEALALYPTRDPYVVMRAMETNAWNHGMSPEDVIAWFRREEPRYPIQFEAIAFDYVGGRLLGTVPDETEFARRFIRFCPDIQSEGPVSARSLGREFKGTREIFCWWD